MAIPRRLRVAGVYPDPPFDIGTEPPTGLDVDLVHALAAELGCAVEFQRYPGADFDGIFSDSVAPTTSSCRARRLHPTDARSPAGARRTCTRDRAWWSPRRAVRRRTTSTASVVSSSGSRRATPPNRWRIASRPRAPSRVYGSTRYDAILDALADVESGAIGAFMKLEPVMRALTRGREALRIVQTGMRRDEGGDMSGDMRAAT